MAILDLQSFQQRTHEVRLFDGEVIKLTKPSQKLVIDILAYEEKMKDTSNVKLVLDSFVSLIVDILNNNIEGRKFTRGYVEKYFNFEIGMVFIQSYIEFVQDINSDPN